MYHGSLTCGTVLLRQDGKIKIGMLCHDQVKSDVSHHTVANIAESILEKKTISPAKALTDTKCIGTIMMELMEPATSILDSKTTALAAPER